MNVDRIVASLLGLMAEQKEVERAKACGMDVVSWRRWQSGMDAQLKKGGSTE